LTKATLECEPLKLTAPTIHAGFNMVAGSSMLKVCCKYLEKVF